MNPDVDLAEIDRIIRETGRSPECVIPLLRKIQDRYNYLPEAALRRVCETTEITPAALAGVSTFYARFRHRPAGRHLLSVCVGTACHVKGAERVTDAILRHLGIPEGQDTDPSGMFTVNKVACVGCCTLAPVVRIDDATHGYVTPGTAGAVVRDFLELQKSRRGNGHGAGGAPRTPAAGEIRIGQGSCCIASGSQDVRQALEEEVRRTRADLRIKPVGCIGMCDQSPLLEVADGTGKTTMYARVSADEAVRVVRRHFRPRGLLGRLRAWTSSALRYVLTDESWSPVTRYSIDTRDPRIGEFLSRQKHIATEHYGRMDPLDFEEYERKDGFKAFRAALERRAPEDLIREITASGLRGRGGGGFPTGRKWATVRAAPGTEKVVIMNGDEGDPGAFMDRMLMECYPYRVLEGLMIAAYAVGARRGVLYVRTEYPLAIERLEAAIRILGERGLLGKDILSSGFGLEVRIMEGAGAFVCGEETALLESLEGRRGMPRYRPPFPAERGLHGLPTLINNVETYACVPWILRHGAVEFARLGTEKSKGTKVFALAGKILRGGLVEVPMGITLREILEEIGGGAREGRTLKAVQIGGPSGGCIPASMGEIPIDFEALTAAGAMMGSGGLVVMDDTDCMVDIALYFLRFMQEESCGKCTPCRVGTKRLREVLERLCAGKGRKGDLARLEEMGREVKAGSLCGLGKTAPNPALTTLRYFRDEYEAHEARRCPARKCAALIRYTILDGCIGCTRCAQVCPSGAIDARPYRKHEIDAARCTSCDMCREVCPAGTVDIVDRFPAAVPERAP